MTLKGKPVEEVEKIIDSDPYFATLYEAESSRNPSARAINPKTKELLSSAKGGFQFIDRTARDIGLEDPFDLGESYDAVQKLTDQHAKRFGSDPLVLYSAHYLGATVLNKLQKGVDLTEKEWAQVDYLKSRALPRFKRIYAEVLAKNKPQEA